MTPFLLCCCITFLILCCVAMICNKQSFWGNGVSARKQRCGHLGKWFFSWKQVDFSSTSSVWAMGVCQKWSRRCVLLLFFYKKGIEPVTKMHVYWYDINLISLPGHTGSWGIQREVSKAAEDMGRAAASVLVPSLPVHMRTRVFLVPAWAVYQATRVVSRLPDISIIVSAQGHRRAFCLNATARQLIVIIPLSFRVWSLRKMLIIIFSLITEKNSKAFLKKKPLIHELNLKQFNVKAGVDFFFSLFFQMKN